MFTVEWLDGLVEKFYSIESRQKYVARLKAYGFHENWDFYCHNYQEEDFGNGI